MSAQGTEALLIADDVDVVIARQCVRGLGRAVGLSNPAIEALATALTEVARNMVVHARGGQVLLEPVREPGRRGVRVVAHDRGPGIADLERALQDGYSTGGGLGYGLAGAQRLVDEFELASRAGHGTTVILKQWVR